VLTCNNDPLQSSALFKLSLIFSALAITSHGVAEGLLPTGGNVVAGAATISEAGSSMTIIQTTAKMAADWQTFTIGTGNSVNFIQPSASAIALNRVLGSDVSVIQGNLTATGQVFLINPNGVLFTPTSQVSVGGLVASTLNLSTADFMAGNFQFGGASSNAIINQGNITVINGGSIALIAAKIINTGSLTADLGDVLLGAGSQVLLDLGGPVKLQVTQAAIDALIQNGGAIRADGGLVYLTAQAAGNLAATVINNTGVIEAHTLATGDLGQIMLMGGMANNRIVVGGVLDASAPHGGSGGFIETSAAHVKLADGVKVTTAAAQGLTGSWLVDPVDFTIAATGGDVTGSTLGTLLASNSITIETSASPTATSTNLVGTTGTNGDIFVNDTISWFAENTLTLNAWGNININQSITSTGAAGKLTLLYGQGALTAGNTAVYNVKAPVNLAAGANFSTMLGSDGALKSYIVITELGAQGSITGTDLQGINGGLAVNYALGSDINAAVTSAWDTGAGFTPIGSIAAPFSAGFDGLGHTITGLTINRPVMASVGLFGQNSPSTTIGNVGLVDGTVVGDAGTGGLVGANTLGSINNSYNTGMVTGGAGTGGLVGSSTTGNISNSYTTGTVTGGAGTGGLVGSRTTGNISNS
jgi:filamentous hemagglutinin family protein